MAWNRGAAAQRLEADSLLRGLREALPEHARRPLEDVLAGRGVSSWRMAAAPDGSRGHLARLFYLRFCTGRCGVEDYRTVLLDAWIHDRAEVERAAKDRNRLRAMFRAAAFPLPDGLPETVRIWRGVARDDAAWRRGISWTLRRPVACWFAMRFANRPRARPAVLTATVPRSSLLYWSDERHECEVVCFGAAGAEVDGAPDDWAQGHRAVCAEIAARRAARLRGAVA